MPMEKDSHEELLNELLSPELEQSRKTEILQSLREDYDSVLGDFQELTEKSDRLEKNNSDLVISNSQLFRQVGNKDRPEKQEEEEQEEFSETVSIEELEKGL